MELFAIVVVAIALLVFRDVLKKNKSAEQVRRHQVSIIAYQVQEALEKLTTYKTNSAKVNNCVKAINLLNEAEAYKECRDVITNFDTLKRRLSKIEKILPVVDYIEKAYKHRFKGKDKSEQSSLLDALYQIKLKEISNQDFVEAEVFPEGTGEIITIEGIKHRLFELGWKEV